MAHGESVKQTIIKTAFELFSDKGFDNVKVQDICDACGITRGAFYYHYKTKDAVLDDIFFTSNQLSINNLQQIMTADNYIDQFYALFYVYLKQIISVGPEVNGEVYKRYISNEVTSLFYPQDFPAFPMYVDLIRRAQEAGQIGSKADPETLAETGAYLSDGLGLVWCGKKGSFDL